MTTITAVDSDAPKVNSLRIEVRDNGLPTDTEKQFVYFNSFASKDDNSFITATEALALTNVTTARNQAINLARSTAVSIKIYDVIGTLLSRHDYDIPLFTVTASTETLALTSGNSYSVTEDVSGNFSILPTTATLTYEIVEQERDDLLTATLSGSTLTLEPAQFDSNWSGSLDVTVEVSAEVPANTTTTRIVYSVTNDRT